MNKTTQPIRNRKKIDEILTYMRGKSYRNFMIAKIQFNTARRISDILTLKVSDFIYENKNLREYVTFVEKKTGKVAKAMINTSLQKAIYEYITNENLKYTEYLFQSQKGFNTPITTTQAHRIFQEVGEALNIENFGTHSLRKTWGYFCYKETKNIALIMEVYNHSKEKDTLRYIGIIQKDIDIMYMQIKF